MFPSCPESYYGTLSQGIKISWDANKGTIQNTDVRLKSECQGIKSFCRAGGFQFIAFNKMVGGSHHNFNWSLKINFNDR